MSTYAFQPSPAAPGREGAQAPVPTQPSTAPAESPPAGGGAGGLGGSLPSLLILVLPILLLFMTMRGQTKKQKQIESSLKTGDTVITQSGMIGKIVDMTETRVKIEIAPGVTVRFLKSAISGVDGGEAKPDASKDKPQEKKA